MMSPAIGDRMIPSPVHPTFIACAPSADGDADRGPAGIT
jgi:hypothetical protein